MSNSSVLRPRLNSVSDGTALSEKGRVFQARAPATGNAQSPSVDRRVDGSGRPELALRGRPKWRREVMLEVSCRVSARFDGALPCRQQCVRTRRRNLILSGTFNRWRSRRSGVTCSNRLAENTNWAAAFSTDWSWWRNDPEIQPALCCSCQLCWRRMLEAASVKHLLTANVSLSVSARVLRRNRL